MVNEESPAHLTGRWTLRGPRVAVLFPTEGDWRVWAMEAIFQASEYWGAVDWVYIPHDSTGNVDPEIVKLLRLYDPDHIVAPLFRLRLLEEANPDKWEELGATLVAKGYEDHVKDQILDDPIYAAGARSAVSALQAATAAFVQRLTPDTPSQALKSTLSDGSGLVKVPNPSDLSGAYVSAADRSWRGVEALTFAAVHGVLDVDRETGPRPEPNALALSLASLGRDGTQTVARELLANLRIGGLPDEFEATPLLNHRSSDLIDVQSGYVASPVVLHEVTDASEWSRALLLQRLIGGVLALSPETAAGLVEGDQSLLGFESALLRRFRHDSDALHFISSPKATSSHITALAHTLESGGDTFPLYGAKAIPGPPRIDQGRRLRVLRDNLGSTFSVPATRSRDGTLTASLPVRPPLPNNLLFAEHDLRVPYWYVDVEPKTQAWPTLPRVSPFGFQAPQSDFDVTVLRPSTAGLSMWTFPQGFVSSGQFVDHKVANPTLVFPALFRWAQLAADEAGHELRLSESGTRVRFIADHLGSLDRLIDLLDDAGWHAASRFCRVRDKTRSDEAFQDGSGVILHQTEPYVRVDAILRHFDDDLGTQFMDRLTQAGLLTCGTVLRCEHCREVDFYPLDRLGATFECHRCLDRARVDAVAWGKNYCEPPLFYDLHKVLRDVMFDHGDVGLRLARVLRRRHRQFHMTPDFEISKAGETRPEAEIDGLALLDGRLAVIECKGTPTLGTGRPRTEAIRKKILAVKLLGATALVLASGNGDWPEAEVAAVQAALAREHLTDTVEVLTFGGLYPPPPPFNGAK